MTNLLNIKIILGTAAVLGGSAGTTYFSTRETVEDLIIKEENSKQLKRIEDWSNHINSLKSEPEKDNTPQNPEFKNLKNEEWKNLKSKCEEIYSRTYKVFWKTRINMENNFKEETKKYCFK